MMYTHESLSLEQVVWIILARLEVETNNIPRGADHFEGTHFLEQ